MTVGSEYERLLADFLSMDGDPESCPFDAGDYVYNGPFIRDGEMVQVTVP
jgi:hypothetical protein